MPAIDSSCLKPRKITVIEPIAKVQFLFFLCVEAIKRRSQINRLLHWHLRREINVEDRHFLKSFVNHKKEDYLLDSLGLGGEIHVGIAN